jgi:hypothetical protein
MSRSLWRRGGWRVVSMGTRVGVVTFTVVPFYVAVGDAWWGVRGIGRVRGARVDAFYWGYLGFTDSAD